MDIEKNRIELYQKVMSKDRYNKVTKQKFRAYTKDYNAFIKDFFGKEKDTTALFNYLVGKKAYTKTQADFFKTFACDLDWAKQTSYCPKPLTKKQIFGTSKDPEVTSGGVQTTTAKDYNDL